MSWRVRVFTFVVGLHLLVIAGLLVNSLIQRWIKPKKKYEVVTTVQLSGPPAPPKAPDEFEAPRPPEPPPKIPDPPPPPPKPAKPKPKLKTPDQVKVSKKKIKPENKPKPQPAPQPPKPKKLTKEELDKILKGLPSDPRETNDNPPSATPRAGELNTLYALIREKMYAAWRQPGGISSSAGYKTEISIRINRSGDISGHRVVNASGHALMDQTALAAASSVKRVTAVPANFPTHQDVTVEFMISD